MIKSLGDLQTFLKICRKQGVIDIKLEGFSVSFGDAPKKSSKDEGEDISQVPTESMSPEELMFYSVDRPINENIQS